MIKTLVDDMSEMEARRRPNKSIRSITILGSSDIYGLVDAEIKSLNKNDFTETLPPRYFRVIRPLLPTVETSNL